MTFLAVAQRMRERHFVVADDAVVEIRDPERAVGAELQINGAEPRVGDAHEVGHLVAHAAAAAPFDAVTVDAAGHDVADDEVALKFFRPRRVVEHGDAADGGAAVAVLNGRGREAESVVGRAEARIPAAAQELVDGRTMAVGGIEVAHRVEGEAEGVYLAVSPLLEARTIHAEAVDVTAR